MMAMAMAIWMMVIMLCDEMNGEVDDAYDDCCEEKRRNVLYGNASAQEVKMICEDRQQVEDDRIHDDKRISPAYLFAALLWPAFQEAMKTLMSHKNSPAHYQAQHMAADDVIRQLVARITLPKRFSAPMKEIWQLQFRLANRAGSRAEKLFTADSCHLVLFASCRHTTFNN